MKIRCEGSHDGEETTPTHPKFMKNGVKMPARGHQDEKMVKFRPKMASNGPHGPISTIFRTIFPLAFPFGQKNEKMGPTRRSTLLRTKCVEGER